jgi:putative flippase GtrA
MSDLRVPTTPREAVALARSLYFNRVFRFLTVGGTCGVIQLSVLHGLVATRGLEEHLANLIAFFISMEINFIFSQLFTWRDRLSPALQTRGFIGRLAMFNVSATMSLVINQSVFALFNIFMWYLPAAALGICAAAFTNFMLNDRIVFRMWSGGAPRATMGQSADPPGTNSIET